MAVFFFDPNSVSDFVALKEGENTGKISSVSMEDASSGGQFLLIAVDFGGLEIKSRINVVHANPAAVEMALRELRSVYLAAGLTKPSDAQALLNRKVKVNLEKQVNEQSGKSYFAITKWLPLAASGVQSAPAQPPMRQAPQRQDAHPYGPNSEVPF